MIANLPQKYYQRCESVVLASVKLTKIFKTKTETKTKTPKRLNMIVDSDYSSVRRWCDHWDGIFTSVALVPFIYSLFAWQNDGLHSFDYAERLSLLGLKRLEERRIRAELVFAYKLLFGFTPLNVLDFFTPYRCTGARGHAYKLFLTRCTTDVRKYFFCNRVAKIWKQLNCLAIPISLVLLHSTVLIRLGLGVF